MAGGRPQSITQAKSKSEVGELRGSEEDARSAQERDDGTFVEQQERRKLAKSLFQSLRHSQADKGTTRKSQLPPKQPLLGGARISAQNKLQMKKYRQVVGARPEDPSKSTDDRQSQAQKSN